MADKTFKCDGQEGRCGREFKPGEWECFPGMKHQVETKTYYMSDAPHCDFMRDPDGVAFRSSRTELHVVPEDVFTDGNGKIQKSSYMPAVFKMGRYETADPQYQFHLEHGTAKKSLCSYEKWFEAYHTPKQKQAIKDGQLQVRQRELEAKVADVERKEREYNDLLASVQKSKKAGN